MIKKCINMKNSWKILIVIFLITLGARLFFAFHTPYYDYDAYFDLRQVKSIVETGEPIFHDTLSYQGRTFIFSPVYHYILAFFDLFLPDDIVFKVLPNIFASLIIFITFLISQKITENDKISIIAAATSAFLPRFFADTINSFSIYTIILPLFLLSIYFLMNIENKKYSLYFTFSVLLMSILHPSSLIIAIGLIVYSIILLIEKIKEERQEIEAMILSIFLILWIQFLIYRQAFMQYGLSIIWQNIPVEIISEYFIRISIFDAIIGIGIIPLVFGIYMVYKFLSKAKNRHNYLLISFLITISLILYLNFIELKIGIMFLGSILAILFAQTYRYIDTTISRTRFSVYNNLIMAAIIFILVLTTIIPALGLAYQNANNTPTNSEIKALSWLKENGMKDSTILVTSKYGFLVEHVSEKKVIMDKDFITQKDISERIEVIRETYNTIYKTDIIENLNKYDIKYIFLSDNIKERFNITSLSFVDDKCFNLIYDDDVQIIQSLCVIEEVQS